MADLVIVKGNDVFTDSMVIAEGTGNEHESIVSMLKKYQDDFTDFGKMEFTDLKSGKRGRPIKVYMLNEPQATLLMTYLGNSPEVRRFKKELVRRFFDMRMILMERQSIQWQQSREKGKQVRKAETDTIKHLTEYAERQGSRNAGRLYTVYSKLANKAVGIQRRELATVMQISHLMVVEDIINRTIQEGMHQEVDYKMIYQACRQKIEEYTALTSLEVAA